MTDDADDFETSPKNVEKADKLQETILKVQRDMAEGNDHIAYEMSLQKKEEEKKKENVIKRIIYIFSILIMTSLLCQI